MKYGEDYEITILLMNENRGHYTEDFFCGNEIIDEYFKNEAADDESAVTYMYINREDFSPVACITIACSAIFTHSEEDGEDVFSTLLPAMEIKYLAVDKKYQSLPYSKDAKAPKLSDVIFDAFICDIMMDIAKNHIGATKIVLYSVPEAVTFYERHGFKEFKDTMYGDKGYFVEECKPMYFDIFHIEEQPVQRA